MALHRNVSKELLKLPAKQYRQVVSAVFELLGDPTPHNAKQMKGNEYWRLAVGEYRVVYRFDDSVVTFVVFGRCIDADVYRALTRMQ